MEDLVSEFGSNVITLPRNPRCTPLERGQYCLRHALADLLMLAHSRCTHRGRSGRTVVLLRPSFLPPRARPLDMLHCGLGCLETTVAVAIHTPRKKHLEQVQVLTLVPLLLFCHDDIFGVG